MNGITNKNQLPVVKKHEIDKPLIQKIDSIFHNCYRDCHNKHFHTFQYNCVYVIQPTNNSNNGIVNLRIADKSMNLYELNKKFKVAPQNGFIFNQTNKLTIKIYSSLSQINIHYYLKHPIPILHRHSSKILSQNPE